MFLPRIELGTLRVLSARDNRYTTETPAKTLLTSILHDLIHILHILVLSFFLPIRFSLTRDKITQLDRQTHFRVVLKNQKTIWAKQIKCVPKTDNKSTIYLTTTGLRYIWTI